ncbi:MAG: glycosyltransferase family 4 protein [Rhodobacteraceae bacterium]|nr:glycosyltransferase family 4 protein [Paracoccaceae bacterium]
MLDKAAMARILPMINGDKPWEGKDLIAHIFGKKKSEALRRAESTLRRIATATSNKKNLSTMLRRYLPGGFSYINVGHSNRQETLWKALRAAGASRMTAMVHDVIPLDFPQFCREDTLERFKTDLINTATYCDCLVFNSTDTANRVRFWLQKWKIQCEGITVLLGVDPLPTPPKPRQSDHPYFVILGTIEPRKNHVLLLDIWKEMANTLHAGQVPHLHIVGRRGWNNRVVFDQLDNAPVMGKCIFEHNNMDDTELANLLSGARALLFPSFAEGFGYPLVEALQKNISAICSNLPCFREIAGDLPEYFEPVDQKGWENAILEKCSRTKATDIAKIPSFPSWHDHFLEIDTIV